MTVSEDEIRKVLRLARTSAKKAAAARDIPHLQDEVYSDLMVFVAAKADAFKPGTRSFSSYVIEYLPGEAMAVAGKLCRQFGLPPYGVEALNREEDPHDELEELEWLIAAEEVLSEMEYDVLMRSDSGESIDDIAASWQVSRRTVYRRLETAQQKMLSL